MRRQLLNELPGQSCTAHWYGAGERGTGEWVAVTLLTIISSEVCDVMVVSFKIMAGVGPLEAPTSLVLTGLVREQPLWILSDSRHSVTELIASQHDLGLTRMRLTISRPPTSSIPILMSRGLTMWAAKTLSCLFKAGLSSLSCTQST
jgi:hypothetical protein